jgi:hypothetical protein
MSYCRFRNTLEDLRDCEENLNDLDSPDISPEEKRAGEKLIALCKKIAEDYSD